jgi:hypothetical protein
MRRRIDDDRFGGRLAERGSEIEERGSEVQDDAGLGLILALGFFWSAGPESQPAHGDGAVRQPGRHDCPAGD